MKLTYKLAAALFCIAAGMSVAAALPNRAEALAAGIALLFIGTVLAAAGARQAAECFRKMRREEQEKRMQSLAEILKAVNRLDASLAKTTERLCGSQKAGLTSVRDGIDEVTAGLVRLSETANETRKIEESAADAAERYDARQNARLEQLSKTVVESMERLRDNEKAGLTSVRDGIDEVALKVDELGNNVGSGLDELPDRMDDQAELLEKLADLAEKLAGPGMEEMKEAVSSLREELSAQLGRMDAAADVFKTSTKELDDGLKEFNRKSETTLNNAEKAAQAQLQALQKFLEEENEKNRSSSEHIMQTYASLAEQDTKLLSSLGLEGNK